MPSRCIFFFSALSAWSILLSRTMICKEGSWPVFEAGVDNRRGNPCLSAGFSHFGLGPLRPQPHISAMAILKIARMGHPVLAQVARPVADPTAPEIHRL